MILLVLAALFTTPPAFSFKNLFSTKKDVEGLTLELKDGYGKASAVDPDGAAEAVAEGAALVNGTIASATGQGTAEGTGTDDDGALTAFAKATVKKFKLKRLNFGFTRVTAGFESNDTSGSSGSSSSEEVVKQSKTLFSIGIDLPKNKTKTLTQVFDFR